MNVLALSIPLAIDKRDLVLSSPNMRTDIGVVQTDFLNEFAAQCCDMVFAGIKTATW